MTTIQDKLLSVLKAIWPVLAGALFGVALRLIFSGNRDGAFDAMMMAFIIFAPVAVTAVTIYVAERERRRTWGYYAAAGAGANVLFVVGTMLIMVEGLICAIVIVPLFAAIGAVMGLLMGLVCRLTDWPKQATYCLSVLPLVLGAFPPVEPLPARERTIERTIEIEAPAQIVWQQLMDIRGIRAEEVDEALAFRIGVPLPHSAVSERTEEGRMRRVSMGKRVYFDQIEVERREHEYIRWNQRFYEDSFPPNSFDQHVVMGGEYFDISDVAYELTPSGAATQLTVRMQYRVSTQFNWYAEPVARIILGNLEERLLGLYRGRSLAAAKFSGEGDRGLEPRL